MGLKENVIVGHLIPAGTGLRGLPESMLSVQTKNTKCLKAGKETS